MNSWVLHLGKTIIKKFLKQNSQENIQAEET